VSKWRNRFAQLRVPGLEDEPRSGRRVINDESVERRILDQLAKAPPPGFARWNGRLVAEIAGVYLTEIEVTNITFHVFQTPNNASAGVIFSQVDSSSISNCAFFSADTGIEDNMSGGGNTYNNNFFTGTAECLTVGGQNNGVPTTLANCRFGGPPN
jgi:hypothetical protein